MSYKNIQEIFDDSSDMVMTRERGSEIIMTYLRFIRRNDDHINFFGGNLLGVHKVVWSPADTTHWLETICEIYDPDSIHNDILDLPGVKSSWKNSTSAINQSFLWVLNKTYNSKLTNAEKEKIMIATLNLMQAKFLTALNNTFFEHGSDVNIATAMYESLSKKSLLKKLKSWGEVLNYRSRYLVLENRKFIAIYKDNSNTKNSIDYVNSIRTRVKKGLNNLTRKYYQTRDEERAIGSYKTFTKIEGETVIRDYERDVDTSINRFKAIAENPADLIRPELLQVVMGIVKTAAVSNVTATLSLLSQIVKTGGKHKKIDVNAALVGYMEYVYSFIRTAHMDPNNLPNVAIRIAAVARAHQTGDARLNEFKRALESIIDVSVTTKHEATRSATKVAVQLYIALRLLTIKHFN